MVLAEFSFQETWISEHQIQTLIPKITNFHGKSLSFTLLRHRDVLGSPRPQVIHCTHQISILPSSCPHCDLGRTITEFLTHRSCGNGVTFLYQFRIAVQGQPTSPPSPSPPPISGRYLKKNMNRPGIQGTFYQY